VRHSRADPFLLSEVADLISCFRCRRLMQMPEWQRVEVLRSWDEWRDQTSDPWRSTWRLLVADIVNLPLIAKTQAKVRSRKDPPPRPRSKFH
jgi:hypothetical protein